MTGLLGLRVGDYIAFDYKYGQFRNPDYEVEVAQVTTVFKDCVLVHWLYGLKSESGIFYERDILAIGDLENGNTEIHGWGGKFRVLQPDIINAYNNQ